MNRDVEVFRCAPEPNFQRLIPNPESEFIRIRRAVGIVQPQWQPVEVSTFDPTDPYRGPGRHADMPSLGSDCLVIRDEALQSVGGVLSQFGEFLEMSTHDGSERFWLFNCLNTLDALDVPSSDIIANPASGRIMIVERFVFRPDRVLGGQVFRVPEMSQLFLSSEIVAVLESAGLAGTSFESIYSDR